MLHIFDKDKNFATQRGYGEFSDWWEFHGGKIEKNEAKQDVLRREIKEELDIGIAIQDFITNDDGSIRSYDATRRIFIGLPRNMVLGKNLVSIAIC